MLEGLGIFATDTVYGMGCAALPNNPAYAEIFALKKRPLEQKLPLLAPSEAVAFSQAAECSPAAAALARAFWPGGLTLILRASEALPEEYVAADGSVAVRVPRAPKLTSLMEEAGALIANTSANMHGKSEPHTLADVPNRFVEAATWIVDEQLAIARTASTIVDVRGSLQSVRIVREGALRAANIEEVLRTCI